MAKIRKIGNSFGLVIPLSCLQMANLQPDDVGVFKIEPGKISFVKSTEAVVSSLDEANRFMAKHKNAFRKLADS